MATKCKRFVVFSLTAYYPGGGFRDYVSSHDTLEEAIAYCKGTKLRDYEYDWYEITDLDDLDWELSKEVSDEINNGN